MKPHGPEALGPVHDGEEMEMSGDTGALSLTFDGPRAVVHGVCAPGARHEWFASAEGHPLFGFRIVGADDRVIEGDSRSDLADLSMTVEGTATHLEARVAAAGIRLSVDIEQSESGCRFDARVVNEEEDALNVELRMPWFSLSEEDLDAVGMVPIEIGTVRPVREGAIKAGGFFANRTFACEADVFPVAHLGLPGDGGLTVEGELERGARDVFEAAADGFGRRATVFLEPGTSATLGSAWIRFHDTWQAAVDDFRRRNAAAVVVDTPDWLRYAGAIYNPIGEGGGGIYQEEETISLVDRISSFDELPAFLDEARRLGTSVIQLFDYWEKDSDDPRPAYWHKGSYSPRRDLGGEEALRRGVRAVRDGGGHMLAYLEPFIVYAPTRYGRTLAERSTARDPWTGLPIDTYPDNFTMVPWDEQWRSYVVSVAEWLVGDIGFDGIFLDSLGWQWNWVCSTGSEHRRDQETWNRGTVVLAAAVRDAIRRIEPEAVVMTESVSLELAVAVDAALDASLAWNRDMNETAIIESPARRAFPELNVFSNGRHAEQLGQVFASGSNLALSARWLAHEETVAELVRIRTRHADALIDGVPRTIELSADRTAALVLFEGTRECVLVAVNVSDRAQSLPLQLTGAWTAATAASESNPGPRVDVPARGLKVWVRQRRE